MVRTTGEAVKLKLTPDKRTIRSDGDDEVFVRGLCVDKEENEVPTAENIISCSLRGNGKIVATDNGDPTCLISFSETVRPAFNGLYLAIIKADKHSEGTLLFTAEAEGVEKVDLKIEINSIFLY